jgi:hypothetical protein
VKNLGKLFGGSAADIGKLPMILMTNLADLLAESGIQIVFILTIGQGIKDDQNPFLHFGRSFIGESYGQDGFKISFRFHEHFEILINQCGCFTGPGGRTVNF